MTEAPEFADDSELLADAFAYARQAHHGPDREGDTDVEHPVAVASLLYSAGFGDEVVAAALLHDVVEDTALGLAEIEASFGPEVRGLVETMTEDESIEDYPERKEEHRRRALAAGSAPAAIYAADKLAKVRGYRDRSAPIDPDRLEHYTATLRLYARARPELPFLDELARVLPELEPATDGSD